MASGTSSPACVPCLQSAGGLCGPATPGHSPAENLGGRPRLFRRKEQPFCFVLAPLDLRADCVDDGLLPFRGEARSMWRLSCRGVVSLLCLNGRVGLLNLRADDRREVTAPTDSRGTGAVSAQGGDPRAVGRADGGCSVRRPWPLVLALSLTLGCSVSS